MAKNRERRRKYLDIRYISIAIGLLVFFLIAFLSEASDFQLFKNMELGLLDQYFRYKTAAGEESIKEGVEHRFVSNKKVSSQIVIIGIDSDSLQELGRWPWPRSVQARVLQSAARISKEENRERAMLLDIFYIEPSAPEEDQVLYDSIRENGRVFLEDILDWELDSAEATRRRTYAYQDFLFRQYPPVKKIAGEWRKVDPFMTDEVPLPRMASAMKGFGHANYSEDKDQVYRRARLVARLSRLVEERNVSLNSFVGEIKSIQVNPDNFEWVAWKDKYGYFRSIPESAWGNESALEDLSRQLAAEALPDSDDAGNRIYRLRVFKDYFIPSIVLSLALEYYHKTPEEVEVKFGEYIRIPNPEVYVLDDSDMKNPQGRWQPYSVNGNPVDEIRIPIDGQGMLLINFMGSGSEKSKTFPVYSFYKLANPDTIPDPAAPPDSWYVSRGLQNKIAIVCAYAQGMAEDEKTTPFGLMYGGEIHANALNTIIMGNFLAKPPVWVTLLMIFAAVLFTAFISSRLPPLLSLFISFWMIACYYIGVVMVFESDNLILNFSAPTVGIFAAILSVVAYRVIFEEQDKRRIKSMFTKYVSPAVVEQLLVHPPELGGVDKEITVLFSDIRGYTSLSETMTAQALVNHLNLYLTKMTDTLLDYLGTLDKYVGDMVMCFWGAPLPQKNHAILACKCALKQMEELRKLNETWPAEKRINIGIGLNSGIMTVGNMGSPGRMNYTIMGDNVNLGSRLEGTNKEYGTNIIISEYTYGLVKDQVIVREMDNIRVKGKNKPVLIYELIDVIGGLDPPAGSEV